MVALHFFCQDPFRIQILHFHDWKLCNKRIDSLLFAESRTTMHLNCAIKGVSCSFRLALFPSCKSVTFHFLVQGMSYLPFSFQWKGCLKCECVLKDSFCRLNPCVFSSLISSLDLHCKTNRQTDWALFHWASLPFPFDELLPNDLPESLCVLLASLFPPKQPLCSLFLLLFSHISMFSLLLSSSIATIVM